MLHGKLLSGLIQPTVNLVPLNPHAKFSQDYISSLCVRANWTNVNSRTVAGTIVDRTYGHMVKGSQQTYMTSRIKIQSVPTDIKGVQKITLVFNFCFAYISAPINLIFRILVSTPHNQGYIMGGRHKNFQDPMYRSYDMSNNKIQNQGYFLHTLYDRRQSLI